jgi:RpiR family transcriptional regulator, carbohydrate utilization regulator
VVSLIIFINCGGITTYPSGRLPKNGKKLIFGKMNQKKPTPHALSRIRSVLPSLAASETRVADWLLQNPHEVIHLSMAELAQDCGVSDTTVLRFCRNAGFQGYMDLKISLAQDLAKPTQIIHDSITEEDNIDAIARKVFQSNIQALHDTLEVMDMNALIRAVDMLEKASRVFLFGVGTSAPIVNDLYNKLFRLGMNVRAQTDAYLQLMEAALLRPGDVALGISQSGSSTDPVLTMQQSKQNAAGTICITGNSRSPITKYADVTLLSVSHETRAETIASRIAQSSIVDVLYVVLAMRNLIAAVQNERLIWNAVIVKTI